ncbi:MAG: CoA transferase [Chloroflexi bacterium]|nr:CoA transferase [Chloroflexota bacterium]MCY3696873.1 CoA transferase [Chloroflexota bacterium]
MTGAGTVITALEGLRVLDISEGLAAPYAAKLLGDLGADVIKLEPTEGDSARRRGPFAGVEDIETSAPFLYANTSKRSVVIDPSNPDDLELQQRLLVEADVVISHETEPALAARGLGFEHLRERNAAVVLVTVTGFGSHGPYAEWQWNHLIAGALGGFTHLCGRPEREPIQLGASVIETLTGAYAAVAALIAVRAAREHGRGDHVDVSAIETAVNAALLPVQRYDYTGVVGTRSADIGPSPSFILPTSDGFVGANVLTQAQWEMMCQFFGRTELIADPLFADGWSRMANSRELAGQLANQTLDRTSEEVFHDAQAWRIPFGLIPDMAEVLNLLPHREREFIFEFEHPRVGRVRMPGVPWLFGDDRPTGTRPPLLGEHTEEVRSASLSTHSAQGEADPAPLSPRSAGGDAEGRGGLPARPLEDLRVIDLSMFMSGPMTSLIFADGGADVIKIESVQRIDGWRASGSADDYWWEWAPQFNWVNRNKHGITLNLNDQRGSDVVRHMVREADILVENYTPRVMGNFGLSYEQLREINPELIMISMPGFGLTGSWSHYTAFANTTEQMSGLPHLTGYADDQPIFSGTTGGDPLAGVMGALALLSALERKRHLNAQGQPGGCHIDLSQTETATCFTGEAVTAYSISGDDPGRVGNIHPRMAPHGTYPCRDNQWIAIVCETNAQFADVARLMGRDDWLQMAWDFVHRDAAREAIDAAIAQWTLSRDAGELMRELQDLRIPAGVVYTGRDLLEDEHLAAREFFITQHHTYAGEHRYPLQPYRFRHWAGPGTDRPSPTLGRDSREVLTRLTALTADQIDQMEADDVIGTIPLAARGD